MSLNRKKEQRKILIQKRAGVKNQSTKSKAIQDKVLELTCYQRAKQILLYRTKGTEVDTRWIWREAVKDGKMVLFPFCPPDGSDMRFYQVTAMDDFVLSSFGVWEPNPTLCKMMELAQDSLCIVPGLSFTENGFRLGYGKGYYDRFLAEHNIFSVGLCYDEMLAENLPIDPFDQAVNMVVTDKKVITVKGYYRI